jgi:hypothetical protein
VEKIDLRKQMRDLFPTGAKARKPHLVTVPALGYLMIDGRGDPNTSEWFQRATGALYAVSYGLKFASKAEGRDYGVMPLEGLWWTDPPEAFSLQDRASWQWTLMIMQPSWLGASQVERSVAEALEKEKVDAALATGLRLETLEEGPAVQALHIGPYAAEAPLIAAMHELAESSGYRLRGKHHEVYLSDPRRIAPEKMKTVLRHPVEKAT